jgi:hypothetical protein
MKDIGLAEDAESATFGVGCGGVVVALHRGMMGCERGVLMGVEACFAGIDPSTIQIRKIGMRVPMSARCCPFEGRTWSLGKASTLAVSDAGT